MAWLSLKAEFTLFYLHDFLSGRRFSRNWQELVDVVYVNLEIREDRRTHMEAMLGKLGVRARRFNAIRAERQSVFQRYSFLRNREISEFVRRGLDGDPPNMGAISNYLSKRELIEGCRGGEFRFTMILEDDICIASNKLFPFVAWKASRMGSGWDVLLSDPAGTWRPQDKVGWNLYFPRATFPIYWGSHALLLNNDRASHVVSTLDSIMIHNIDGILFTNRTAIKTFAIQTGLCGQSDFGSDIRL